MDEIILAIHNRIPKFEDYTLKGFIQETVDDIHNSVATCYSEAVKLVPEAVKFVKHVILPPEERVRRELTWSKRPRISLAQSDVQLVEYQLKHEGEIRSAFMYTPYMTHGFLHIKGKRYAVNLGICEQTFSRIEDKSTDGVMVRTIRAPIPFGRKIRHRIDSAVTGACLASEFIVTAKLHHKKHGKRKRDTTVFLYLAAREGFDRAIFRFGLTPDEMCFVEQYETHDSAYEYIFAKADSCANRNLYLKVRKDVFENPVWRKLVCNIIYTLSGFEIQHLRDMHDPTGNIWRIILGKIIYPEDSIPKARSDADTHLASVDVFLDPISKKRFNDFNVPVRDIYELLVYIFTNIDGLMVNGLSQDLYTKRIDVMEGLLIAPFATAIFSKFYSTNQRQTLREAEVKALVKMRPWTLDSAWSTSQRGHVQNVTTGTQLFNGNWLSFGIFKNRADGNAEQRFHPSMAVVESITAFSGKDVGRTGYINPYLQVGKNGGIIHPEHAKEIDVITAYLPRN